MIISSGLDGEGMISCQRMDVWNIKMHYYREVS